MLKNVKYSYLPEKVRQRMHQQVSTFRDCVLVGCPVTVEWSRSVVFGSGIIVGSCGYVHEVCGLSRDTEGQQGSNIDR